MTIFPQDKFGALLGILGLIIGIAGILIGIWLYLLAKRRPALTYLVSDSIILAVHNRAYASQLEIRFLGEVVPSVIATTIALWNDGNTTITRDQIVAADPLRAIVQDGAKILRAAVVASSREVLEAEIGERPAGSVAAISFEFLEPGDGFLVQILHSGDYGRVSVLGTLRELNGGPKRFDGTSILSRPKRHAAISISVSMALVLVLFGVGKLLVLVQGSSLQWWEWGPLVVLIFGATILGPLLPEMITRRRLARFPALLRGQPGIAFFLRTLL